MASASVVSTWARGFVMTLREPLSKDFQLRNLQPRVFGMLILWTVFLSIPFLMGSDQWPRNSVTTLLKSSMPFILALKLSQLIWFPKDKTSKAAEQGRESSRKVEDITLQTRLVSLARTCGSLLFLLFPISKSKRVPTWSHWIRMNLEFVWWIGIKMIGYAVVYQWMQQILARQQTDTTCGLNSSSSLLHSFTIFHDPDYAKLVTLYSVMVLTGCWVQDALGCLISIVSLGYYEQLSFLNYPLLSKSLKDFWSHRYNLMTHDLLKECVYIPAQNYGGHSKRTARYLTFAVSGLIHVYSDYFTFGGGYGRTMAFFLLQPVWIDVEERLVIPAGRTHLFFWLTLFLYLGLFVEVLPEFLEKSALESIHPWIDETATSILQWLNHFMDHVSPYP